MDRAVLCAETSGYPIELKSNKLAYNKEYMHANFGNYLNELTGVNYSIV